MGRHALNGERTPAQCHPERPVKGNGLCSLCYAKVRYARNPEVFRERARRYRLREHDRHPGRIASVKRREHLKRTYGLTEQQFEIMRHAQGNRCAICQRPFTTVPHIDHDHASGRVRGLLCARCNPVLRALDDANLFKACTEYLQRSGELLADNRHSMRDC